MHWGPVLISEDLTVGLGVVVEVERQQLVGTIRRPESRVDGLYKLKGNGDRLHGQSQGRKSLKEVKRGILGVDGDIDILFVIAIAVVVSMHL